MLRIKAGLNVIIKCGRCKSKFILAFGFGVFDYDYIEENCKCAKCKNFAFVDMIRLKSCEYQTYYGFPKRYSSIKNVLGEETFDEIPTKKNIRFGFNVSKINQIGKKPIINEPFLKQTPEDTLVKSNLDSLKSRSVPNMNFDTSDSMYGSMVSYDSLVRRDEQYNTRKRVETAQQPAVNPGYKQPQQPSVNQGYSRQPPNKQPQQLRSRNVVNQQPSQFHQQNRQQNNKGPRGIDIQKKRRSAPKKTTDLHSSRFQSRFRKSHTLGTKLSSREIYNLGYKSSSRRKQDFSHIGRTLTTAGYRNGSSSTHNNQSRLVNRGGAQNRVPQYPQQGFRLLQEPTGTEKEIVMRPRMEMTKEYLSECELDDKTISILRAIGKGAYGSVFVAKWDGAGGGMKVAVKEIVYGNDFSLKEKIMREYITMMKMSYYKVIRVFGFTLPVGKVRILMDLMEGDVMGLVKERKDLTVYSKFKLMREMTLGVNYLHARRVVHRDIKSYNFLYKNGGEEIVITDFGLALALDPNTTCKTAGFSGTLRWMSPELLSARPKYKFSSDIYALGVTFWEVLFETIPFGDVGSDAVLIQKIRAGEKPKMNDPSFPHELKGLVEVCMFHDHTRRPTTKHILEWFEYYEKTFKEKYSKVMKFKVE